MGIAKENTPKPFTIYKEKQESFLELKPLKIFFFSKRRGFCFKK